MTDNGFCSGQFCTIQPENIFLRLPCNEDAYAAGLESDTPFYENGVVGDDLTLAKKGKTSDTRGAMSHLVQISSIWADVLTAAYRGVHLPKSQYASKYRDLYRSIDERLKRWMDELPHCLVHCPENTELGIRKGHTGTYISLHTLYHVAAIQLNRLIRLDVLPRETICDNIRRAMEHSRQLLRMMGALAEIKPESLGSEDDKEELELALSIPFPSYAILAATDILSAGGLVSELDETRRHLREGLEIVTRLAKFWASAEQQRRAIEQRLLEMSTIGLRNHERSSVFKPESVGKFLHSQPWRLAKCMETEKMMELKAEHDCIYGSSMDIFEAVSAK